MNARALLAAALLALAISLGLTVLGTPGDATTTRSAADPATTGTPDAETPSPAPEQAPGAPASPTGATAAYAVPHGSPDAPVVVTIYEDFQCPYCRALAEYSQTGLADLLDQGAVRVEYQPISILDGASQGYSTRAMNAYAAVLHTAGPDIATQYRTALFVNQPTEGGPGLSDADLISLAVQVGATEAKITGLITNVAFLDWVAQASQAAAAAGIDKTPTVLVNGRPVTQPLSDEFPTAITNALTPNGATR